MMTCHEYLALEDISYSPITLKPSRLSSSSSSCTSSPSSILPFILQLYRLRDEVESKKKMKRRQKRIREKAEKDKERKEKEQEGATEALGKHPTVRTSTSPSVLSPLSSPTLLFSPLRPSSSLLSLLLLYQFHRLYLTSPPMPLTVTLMCIATCWLYGCTYRSSSSTVTFTPVDALSLLNYLTI
jgi:hypothetical protein